MYMDGVINDLRESDYGCHLGRLYIGCIAYADDLILIAASVCDLQKMLDVCFKVGSRLDTVFNAVKSFLFKMGPAHNDHLCELRMGNTYIKWTDRLKYLGIQLLSFKFFRSDISGVLRKVYVYGERAFFKKILEKILRTRCQKM